MKRMFVFALAMAMIFGFTSSAVAELTATQSTDAGVVSVKIEYTETLSSLGYQATLPNGMTVEDKDEVKNVQCTKDQCVVDFYQIKPDEDGTVDFSYTVCGEGKISADVMYSIGSGSQIRTPMNEVEVDVKCE